MQTETAIAAAMSRAGLNTTEAHLRMIATDAMKKHHGNIERAIKTFEKEIDGDRDLIREALAFYLSRFRLPEADQFIADAQMGHVGDRQTNGDGRGHPPLANQNSGAASSLRDGVGQDADATRQNFARPVREPSAQERAAEIAARTKAAVNVFDRELTHTGRRWGNVYYRELDSMADDGQVALAIKIHIGSLRGDDRNKTIRDLMTPREFSGVMRKAGRSAHAA